MGAGDVSLLSRGLVQAARREAGVSVSSLLAPAGTAPTGLAGSANVVENWRTG